MREVYYRSKIIELIDKIFIESGDARSRIRSCEDKIFSAYIASKSTDVPISITNRWEEIWKEISNKKDLYAKDGKLIRSSLAATLSGKHNKSMEKYLSFFLEEFYRVI